MSLGAALNEGSGRMREPGDAVRAMIGLRRHMNPEERLAGAVILRAVQDCSRMYLDPRRPTGSWSNRIPGTVKSGSPPKRNRYVYRDDGRVRGIDADTARVFLSRPSALLTFWCNVLGVSPDLIIDVYTRTICQPPPA